ncbi:uncharacterized protein LOC144359181 [Saccoglossus kowalevskii]
MVTFDVALSKTDSLLEYDMSELRLFVCRDEPLTGEADLTTISGEFNVNPPYNEFYLMADYEEILGATSYVQLNASNCDQVHFLCVLAMVGTTDEIYDYSPASYQCLTFGGGIENAGNKDCDYFEQPPDSGNLKLIGPTNVQLLLLALVFMLFI